MAERDKQRAISNPQLLSELQGRVDRDQEARRAWLRSPSDQELANRVDEIDSENVAWLRNLRAENCQLQTLLGIPTECCWP